MKNKVYTSAFDSLDRKPLEKERLKLQSALLQSIRNYIYEAELTESQVSNIFAISLEEANDIFHAKFSSFSLDDLLMIMYQGKLYVEEMNLYRGLGY